MPASIVVTHSQGLGVFRYETTGMCQGNAEFIAHAREDIPALAAEVENLKLERDWFMEVVTNLENEVSHLREALTLIATPKRPDGTYNYSREACEEIARKALQTNKN